MIHVVSLSSHNHYILCCHLQIQHTAAERKVRSKKTFPSIAELKAEATTANKVVTMTECGNMLIEMQKFKTKVRNPGT